MRDKGREKGKRWREKEKIESVCENKVLCEKKGEV